MQPKLLFIPLISFALGMVIYSSAVPSDGAAVYKAKCVTCHAADGSGQTPVGKSLHLKDLRSAEVQKHTDAELRQVIADGRGKMPAYKGTLSEDDILKLVAFIRGLRH